MATKAATKKKSKSTTKRATSKSSVSTQASATESLPPTKVKPDPAPSRLDKQVDQGDKAFSPTEATSARSRTEVPEKGEPETRVRSNHPLVLEDPEDKELRKNPEQRKPAPHAPLAGGPAQTERKKEITEDVTPNLPEGTKVELHENHVGDIEAARGRAPLGAPLQKGKIRKDGTFGLKVDKPGIYTIAYQRDEDDNDSWRYIKVPVKG